MPETSKDLGATLASSWLHCTVSDLAPSRDSRPNSSPEAWQKEVRCGQTHQTCVSSWRSQGSQAGQAGLCELSVSRSEAEKEGAPAAGDCPQSVATGWMVEAPVNSDPLACP